MVAPTIPSLDWTNHWQRLVALVEAADCQVFLVAPFVKNAIIERLVAGTKPVAKLTLVTRWRAEEIARGVTDFEARAAVLSHPRGRFLTLGSLHAKYYSSEVSTLSGSANLTQLGLGVAPGANMELMVLGARGHRSELFEKQLVAQCSEPDDVVARIMAKTVQSLRAGLGGIRTLDESLHDLTGAAHSGPWFPRTRYPDRLWIAYTRRFDELTCAALDSTQLDLLWLALPRGLSPSAFRDLVQSRLVTAPFFSELDTFLDTSRRFGEVRALIAKNANRWGVLEEPGRSWQTLMQWLLHFFPERYMAWTANYSEIFQRVDS